MSREALYLAGWLTTAVVAVVVIFGISNGAFGPDSVAETTPQVVEIPYIEPQSSTVPLQVVVPQMEEAIQVENVSSFTDGQVDFTELPIVDEQVVDPQPPIAESIPVIEYVYPDDSTAPAPMEQPVEPTQIIEYVYPDGSPAPAPIELPAGPAPIIEYVYPDGSPAPAPSDEPAPMDRGYYDDDDDDEHEGRHHDDDDDDDHDDDDDDDDDDDEHDDDDDDGLEGILHWVFDRD